ncbi:MAG: hypothetical protein ONB11_03985 [candidate division KSB1 bacterium]|nr:hypothetical protein [candidate division KSB1 bacterium]
MGLFDSFMDSVLDLVDKLKSNTKLHQAIAGFKIALQDEIRQLMQKPTSAAASELLKKWFTKAQAAAEKLYPEIWQEWFNLAPYRLNSLPQHLSELSIELTEPAYGTLLKSLLQQCPDSQQLFQEVAIFCLADSTRFKQRLSQLWSPFLASALQTLGSRGFVKALCATMTSARAELQQKISLCDLEIIDHTSATAILQKVLRSQPFQLPAGVIISGMGLGHLFLHSNFPAELAPVATPEQTAESLFAPLKRSMVEIDLQPSHQIDGALITRAMVDLIHEAQQDEAVEWALLSMARYTPLGIQLIIAAIFHCLRHNLLPWWKLLFKEIENDPKLKVKRLPAPTPGGPKYLILSDIHRDARSDQREPLEFGSIDHFSANQQLYCEILDYAFDHGFTVLEVGDCDELWFFRDYSIGPREKLQQIVATHQAVYDRLFKLHRAGRYIRVYGNHDCYIRRPDVFAVLQEIFDKDRAPTEPPFAVYDFAIIDGVKTMDESILHFGLDSTPYTSKAPMIIAHGHQWDFWNCDENNIIGKLIVSAIATPVDFLDDPFIDAGGIAFSGSPIINFADVLANAFILQSFPAYLPARKLAHRIQHLRDRKRHTKDNIFYLESLAALTGATIKVKKAPDVTEYQKNNLICLGHTHYPQSQPYYNLRSLIPFIAPLIINLEQGISHRVHGLFRPQMAFVKSRYFNSGTAGWMEGVVWAIQVDETGQARSIYWTRDTRIDCPQTMDWELPVMEEELRKKLERRKGSYLHTIENLSRIVDSWLDFKNIGKKRACAIRLEELLPQAERMPRSATLTTEFKAFADPLGPLFISLLGSATPQTHTVRLALDPATASLLTRMQQVVAAIFDITEAESARYAAAWLLVSRSLPFLGEARPRSAAATAPDASLALPLKAALTLALQLPGETPEQLPIQSQIDITEKELIIQMTTHPQHAKEAVQPASKMEQVVPDE